MAKPKAVFSFEDRRARLDELLARERHQRVPAESRSASGVQVGDGSASELLADHRCSLDHCALLGVETVQAGREESVDRRRDREIRRARPVLGEHCEHLLDEERIALGRIGDAGEELSAQLGLALQELEKGLGFQVPRAARA